MPEEAAHGRINRLQIEPSDATLCKRYLGHMNTVNELKALLKTLEWSGRADGPSLNMGGRPEPVICCPSCNGVAPHEPIAGAYRIVGHKEGCLLQKAIS